MCVNEVQQNIAVTKSHRLKIFFAQTRYERIQNDSEVHVSHEAIYEFYYEPFYVAHDIVPDFDERFLGYGYTRNTQVWIWSFFCKEFLLYFGNPANLN
jgi:hypothetical protein